MKRLLLSVLMLLCSVTMLAQSRYVVYKSTGEVAVQKYKSTAWKPVEKRMEVLLMDSFRIGDSSSVGVLDNTTNRIYRSSEAGECRVKAIIDDARRRSDKITGELNRELLKELSDNGRTTPDYSLLGATVRGEGDGASVTDSVYRALKKVVEGVFSGAELPADAQFSLNRKYVSENEFFFEIRNGSKDPYVVNVLKIDRNTGKAALCFDFGYACDNPYVIIPADGRIAAEQFVFADSSADAVYVLFATPDSFDTQALQILLSTMPDVPDSSAEYSRLIVARME